MSLGLFESVGSVYGIVLLDLSRSLILDDDPNLPASDVMVVPVLSSAEAWDGELVGARLGEHQLAWICAGPPFLISVLSAVESTSMAR